MSSALHEGGHHLGSLQLTDLTFGQMVASISLSKIVLGEPCHRLVPLGTNVGQDKVPECVKQTQLLTSISCRRTWILG